MCSCAVSLCFCDNALMVIDGVPNNKVSCIFLNFSCNGEQFSELVFLDGNFQPSKLFFSSVIVVIINFLQ